MTIAFALTDFEYGIGRAVGVDPVIGGEPLRDLVERFESRHGWTPAGGYGPLLPQLARAWFLAPEPDDPCAVLGCVCGDDGCWPLTCTITVTDELVSWSDFRQPWREEWSYDGFGPFVFPRQAYETAVRDLFDRWGTPLVRHENPPDLPGSSG